MAQGLGRGPYNPGTLKFHLNLTVKLPLPQPPENVSVTLLALGQVLDELGFPPVFSIHSGLPDLSYSVRPCQGVPSERSPGHQFSPWFYGHPGRRQAPRPGRHAQPKAEAREMSQHAKEYFLIFTQFRRLMVLSLGICSGNFRTSFIHLHVLLLIICFWYSPSMENSSEMQ